MQSSKERISARDRAICRNIFLVAKENADNLFSIRMHNSGSGEGINFFGGLYHNRNQRLKDAGLNEIDAACNFCNSKAGCAIVIYLLSNKI